jgi:acyl-CoA thioesterase FadM
VHTGTLDIDVTVLRVGTTSFTVRCAVSQDGRPAARVDVVLVSFGYAERQPLPLTAAQRDQLERVTVPG